MLIKFSIPLFIFLSMCYFFDCKEDINQPNWLKGLVKYIKEDSATYQTLLIIDEDCFKKEEQIGKILKELQQVKPIIHFLVRNETIEEDIRLLKQSKAFGFPTTTLFIVIDSIQNNLVIAQGAIKLISILLKGRFRPKFLVLQFSDAEKSLDPIKKKLLRTAWNNQFLDVSILEIVKNTSKVHYFNPFMNIFSTKKYSSGTALFPDKLRNMNRYVLKASTSYFPPFVTITYNSSGYSIYSGRDIFLLNAFAQKMNFISKIQKIDNVNLSNLTQQLLLNKVQIGLFRTMIQKIGKDFFLEQLVLGLGSFNAITPKMQIQKDFKTFNFLQALYPLFVFSAILWLLMYVLKKFSNDWNLSFTVQVVLGVTTPQQPEHLKARIIFAYMVIVSFVYSSKIYAMLTSINLQTVPELQLTTLAELDKSGLGLEIDPMIISWLDPDIQSLNIVQKSRSQFFSPIECVLHAISDKNVSCNLLKTDSKWFNSHFKTKDGTALTGTVEEPFAISAEGFYLESGSPYAERFNNLFLRLMAFGLFEKWNKDVVPTTSAAGRNKEALDDLMISHNKLLSILLTELLSGFLIAGIVFVIEIIVAKISRKKDRGARTLE